MTQSTDQLSILRHTLYLPIPTLGMISSKPVQLVLLSDTVSVAISLQFFEKILEKDSGYGDKSRSGYGL